MAHASSPTIATALQNAWHGVALVAVVLALDAVPIHAQGQPATAPSPEVEGPAPPPDLSSAEAWVDYRERGGFASLPDEARVFFHRARIAWNQGRRANAVRDMQGAAALDPSFAAPHLALIRWQLARDPSQALQSCAALVALARRSFPLQAALAADSLFWMFHTLFFGVLAAALLLIAARQHELRHAWKERLSRVLAPASAGVWAWALLFLPFLVGWGLALPGLFLLGLAWPLLRARERLVFVALITIVAAAPLAQGALARLAQATRDDAAPLYGIGSIEDAPYSAERENRLAQIPEAAADNPWVHFGRAWNARRGGDLAVSEASYRRVLELWPQHGVTLNNLGNVLALQGFHDEALELYRRAAQLEPENAAPHLNLSQVHTLRFEFEPAKAAVDRASALDFDLVQSIQRRTAADGSLPLADLWLSPAVPWRALWEAHRRDPVLADVPGPWRLGIETGGWPVSAAALLLGALGVILGYRWNNAMPVRHCSNCGRVVCRRCAVRSREFKLCPVCSGAAARASSPNFSNVLLVREKRSMDRKTRWLRTGFAVVAPGFGLIAERRIFGPLAQLTTLAMAVSCLLGVRGPFAAELDPGGTLLPITGAWALVILVYLWSLLGYLVRSARRAPQPRVQPAVRAAEPVRAAA